MFVNPYLGYTWWDQETDGELMYPKQQHDPTDEEMVRGWRGAIPKARPRAASGAIRNFVARVAELNPQLKSTQFADYHGHGWVFRAVFKKDRKGNLLDLKDDKIAHDDPQKFAKAVHLKDIHLERGMQCVDCHFDLDVHGNGQLYGEPRNATTITCVDCHGTVSATADPDHERQRREGRSAQHQQHAVGSAFHLAGHAAVPAIDHVARSALGSAADDRHGRSALGALQREERLREDAAARRHDVGRDAAGRR